MEPVASARSQHYFFVVLLIGAFILVALVFLPFMTALVIGIVLSVLFRPLHKLVSKIFSGGNQESSLSAIVTMVIVAVLVITPLTFLLVRLYHETQNFYIELTDETVRTSIVDALNSASATISKDLFDMQSSVNFDSFNVTTYIENFFDWGLSNLDTLFSSIANIALNIFIILLSLFYLLRDGGSLKRQIFSLSPLVNEHEDQIFAKLKSAIHSVVTGSLIVCAVQGVLTGVGFALFGIPNPVLWGTVAMVAALIPGVGTALVLVPGIIYLFISSTTPYAWGLLVWGILAVGLIDNLLGSILMNRQVRIHPFLILISVLGGLAFFGPVGFVLGPIALAFLFALIEIYKKGNV